MDGISSNGYQNAGGLYSPLDIYGSQLGQDRLNRGSSQRRRGAGEQSAESSSGVEVNISQEALAQSRQQGSQSSTQVNNASASLQAPTTYTAQPEQRVAGMQQFTDNRTETINERDTRLGVAPKPLAGSASNTQRGRGVSPDQTNQSEQVNDNEAKEPAGMEQPNNNRTGITTPLNMAARTYNGMSNRQDVTMSTVLMGA